MTCILSSAISVMNQSRRWLSLPNSTQQHRQHQAFIHAFLQLPAHDSPGEAIHEHGQEAEHTTTKRYLRNITNPQLIDRRRLRFL
jgi:hypothetical protein